MKTEFLQSANAFVRSYEQQATRLRQLEILLENLKLDIQNENLDTQETYDAMLDKISEF